MTILLNIIYGIISSTIVALIFRFIDNEKQK